MTENIRVCRACLSFNNKLYNLSECSIDDCIKGCLGFSVPSTNPQHICYICLHLIKKFILFRKQCVYSDKILSVMLFSKEVDNLSSSVYETPKYFNYMPTKPEIRSYFSNDTQDTYISETQLKHMSLPDDIEDNMKVELLNDAPTIKEFVENFCDESVTDEDDCVKNAEDEMEMKHFEESFCEETRTSELRKRHISTESDIDMKKDLIDKRIRSQRGSKVKKRIEETSVKEEFDERKSENYKNALLFYNLQPNIKRSVLKRRVAILDKFSKTYMVDIKILTAEEQKREIEKRKERYKNLPFICEHCNRGYNTPESYEAHLRIHDPSVGDYACNTCGVRSRTARDRAKHINITHLKRFTCKLCGKITKSQSFAKAHFASHNEDDIKQQPNGNSNYVTDKNGTISSECGPHSCEICGDLFNTKMGLKIHMGVVHKQAVKCRTCKHIFEGSLVLNKHICQDGVSPCPSCGVNFSSEKLMKKHHEEKHKTDFNCDQCDKTFTCRMEYKMHINRHSKGDEDLKPGGVMLCEICGKRNFKSYVALQLHQRVHTDERPFSCHVCQKTFRHDTTLKCHLRVHTGERRYKCTICDKAFKQVPHRTAHLLTHTRERPYPCNACPKRYTSATALKEHTNTAHKGLPPRQRRKNKLMTE